MPWLYAAGGLGANAAPRFASTRLATKIMSTLNARENSLVCKLVYDGPALAGKTTSLRSIHSVLDPAQATRPVLLRTEDARTLFFDFIPFDLGAACGHRVRIQGFTAPGEVRYNLTRRCLLMGADGVVFVADAAREKLDENRAALASLTANLRANNMDPSRIPLVLQYNRRDAADALSREELDAALNPHALPSFSTNALKGEGVFDAFATAVQRILNQKASKHRLVFEEPLGDVALRWLARFATPRR